MSNKQFQLTQSQKVAKKEILGTINSSKLTSADRFRTLNGVAGSGKSTVTVDIIKSLSPSLNIGLCATTHKAVKVIATMALEQGIMHRVDCRTIHSALGLKLIQQGEREICIKDNFKSEYLYDVLFIDECSPIDDDLYEFITDCESKTIIFIGDKCQISPVCSDYNHVVKTSQVFDCDNHPQSNLTEVVRCALDNPIISLATQLRLCQDDPSPMLPDILTNVDKNKHGVYTYNGADFIKAMVAAFKTKEFREDTDFCRCIAYTNNKIKNFNKIEIMGVNEINSAIRQLLHGDVQEYIIGETIISQSGTEDYKNSNEFTINSIKDGYYEDELIPSGIDVWEMNITNKFEDTEHDVIVVKSTSLDYYNRVLQSYVKSAKSDKNSAALHWKHFWELKKKFNEFKHIYCMTTHKAQGSTFQHTFIYTPNFIAKGVQDETKRLLYTACTRSSLATHFCK